MADALGFHYLHCNRKLNIHVLEGGLKMSIFPLGLMYYPGDKNMKKMKVGDNSPVLGISGS